jgi:hypothetical protein
MAPTKGGKMVIGRGPHTIRVPRGVQFFET